MWVIQTNPTIIVHNLGSSSIILEKNTGMDQNIEATRNKARQETKVMYETLQQGKGT